LIAQKSGKYKIGYLSPKCIKMYQIAQNFSMNSQQQPNSTSNGYIQKKINQKYEKCRKRYLVSQSQIKGEELFVVTYRYLNCRYR
jgi:hypothetical protein